MSHLRQRLHLRRKRQKNGFRLIGLTLSMVLLLVGSGEAAVAQAAAAAESSHACDMVTDPATAFAMDNVPDAVVTTRIGCARDAGSLRSLTNSADDLVMTLDVVSSDHLPALRRLAVAIRDYQDTGRPSGSGASATSRQARTPSPDGSLDDIRLHRLRGDARRAHRLDAPTERYCPIHRRTRDRRTDRYRAMPWLYPSRPAGRPQGRCPSAVGHRGP